jgi:hypothetical protein
VSDQVSHPYKTSGKILFLYIYLNCQIRLRRPEGIFCFK